MVRRLPPVVLAPLVLVLAASGGAGGAGGASSDASARAFGIRVVSPGGGGGTREIAAPPDAVQFAGSFSYGGAVATGAITGSVSASSKPGSADASAGSAVTGVSLFGGEVTIGQVTAKATATARSGTASGDVSQSFVSDFVVGGTAVSTAPGRVALADWGYAVVLAQGSAPSGAAYRGFVTGVELRLTADHGGLPAGTSIQLGFAEASAQADAVPPPPPPPPPPAASPPSPPSVAAPGPSSGTGAKKGSAKKALPPLVRRPPPGIVPRLTKAGYVFPVYGPSSFADTFGAGRAVVGWHHGEDVFAAMGAPVLAVAAGTVFSVGWNDIGGNRLWLRDRSGNEFYYAHLSAFSPRAVNGAQVQPGEVLGFVGNTGDAQTTPPHLHFEIHPVEMLPLGYDGVVNPHPALLAWQHLEDVRFPAGPRWLPSLGAPSTAPQPGAYLLSSSDISTASGLEPQSMRRALAARSPVALARAIARERAPQTPRAPRPLGRPSSEEPLPGAE